MDAGTEQIGIGGALFLGALGMLLKYKPWAGAPTKVDRAGEKPTEYWLLEFEKLVENGVRKGLAGRNEDIRRMIREELQRHQR